MKRTRGLLGISAFAKRVGVTQQAASKAIKLGRVKAYDATGARVPSDYKGRKFVKPDEAAAAFQTSRARVNDSDLKKLEMELDRELEPAIKALSEAEAGQDDVPLSLVEARTKKETLLSKLLEIRLARERSELLSRDSAIAAFENAGRATNLALMTIPHWSEALAASLHSGGIPALTALLRQKATALCNDITDALESASGELGGDL
jgi:hypothetical protein